MMPRTVCSTGRHRPLWIDLNGRLTGIILMMMATVGGADPVITSFHTSGDLTWTSGIHTNGRYEVQWATSPGGPWRQSWQSLQNIEAHSATNFAVTVPMFYRVVMVTNHPPIGMQRIDAGPFVMGDAGLSGGWLYAVPTHTVDVPAFYMDRYEVSNARMCEVLNWATAEGLVGWYGTQDFARNLEGSPAQDLLRMAEPACRISYDGNVGKYSVDAGAENLPCVEVTWHGALAYCNYRSDMEGLERAITFGGDFSIDFTKEGYRLPTEAEWEKAARGGRADHFYPWPSHGGTYSNHIDGSMANYSGSGDPFDSGGDLGVTPVGYYNGSQQITNAAGELLSAMDMANGYGLYDMAGNVAELCTDRPATNYVGAPTDGSSMNGPEVNHRVIRGGSFTSGLKGVLSADREDVLYVDHTNSHERNLGFRCVRRAP
jgi:sulfatase modifying factor 1